MSSMRANVFVNKLANDGICSPRVIESSCNSFSEDIALCRFKDYIVSCGYRLMRSRINNA